ncbi:TonB-dependent receptor [Flavobacteriaceae bacterium F89]|uniref:TonB-dependent receptor n=1 Tax=Cerina litoralis TaxID=2874477 RepID=A0AAE3EXV2_9FLAO|nr:TonB-dependent receptor [Cerina litoralis]MCG2462505.1 TonB-dependent receptor [Cerina litoralis]
METVQNQVSISGNIKDSHGEPLMGAAIVVKGTTTGTTADIDGNFQLTIENSDAILMVSFLGMVTKEIPVGNKTVFDIVLEDDFSSLEEVVVVGYGTTKKSDLTGAIASVKGKDLNVTSSQDVLSGMQGKMAGVHITKNSGAPGADALVRIRGIGTINNSDPIYVVDGFQVSDINYLSVNDIESIEVLKDASATAIYGSRGANGVILVTTKKGGGKGVQFSLNYNYGVQSASKKIDMLNAWQFATLYREANSNSGITLSAYEDKVTQFVIDHKSEGTDWQDQVFREYTPVQNLDFSVSGKSGKNSYLGSVFYNSNEGLVKYNDFSKLNLRLQNSYAITDKITWDIDVSYSKSDKQDIDGGVLTSSLYMDPIAPAWDENTNNYGTRTFNAIEGSNPAMLIDHSQYDRLSWTNRIVGNTSVSVRDIFISGLSFKSRFGYDNNTIKGKGYYPEFYVDTNTYNQESSLYQNERNLISMLWSNYFSYEKIIGKHSINAMLGTEMQNFENEYVSGTVYDVPNDPNQMYFDLASNLERKALEGNFKESRLLSYFGRVNYKFLDRYILTATLRADGSSKFLGDNRWGIFPSAAVAWDLMKEPSMQGNNVISNLKLRSGWGIVGNQNSLNNPYVYASTITSQSNSYVIGGQIVNGYYPAALANKDIKWETTETFNLGIDLGLFEDKLALDANVFQNTTSDMIATPQAPVYVGYNAVPSNIGSVRNKGIEVTLGHKNKIGDLSYNINWNITALKNEVLDLGTSTAIIAGSLPRLDPTTYTDVGNEIGAFRGLATNGIFTQETLDALHAQYPGYQPTAQPGDVWFVDADGDHKIDKNNDRQYLGSAVPDFTSGLNIQLNWKNIDFSCYFIGSYGNEIVNGQYVYIYGSNIKSNWHADMWNRSHGDVITDIPRLDIADVNGNTSTFSDRFVEDGSYLRLKNIQIGYSFPESLYSKVKLSEFRVYFSADNLLTFTKYSGWDPEPVSFGTLNGGVDYGTYPLPRVLSLGLNLKF